MQVWKRRLLVLVAVSAGVAGLTTSSTAGAQTSPPTSFPSFTFPSFTLPTFTIPPPTMPPPTTSITSPPPTMPPTSVPVFDREETIEGILDRLENLIEEGEAGFEEFQALLEQIRSSFFD